MSIFSSLDSQSLLLTRKLLDGRAPSLSNALPQYTHSRYPVDEVTVELDIVTINGIIDELTEIGKIWFDDTDNDCYQERKQIISYLLKQWIKVGEDATKLTHSTLNVLH